MGTTVLHPLRRKVFCEFLSPLKIRRLDRVYPRTLGTMASTQNEACDQRIEIIALNCERKQQKILYNLVRFRTMIQAQSMHIVRIRMSEIS
jgi:hypothetical protein